MLIQQIIKQQTINILDRILQADNAFQNKQHHQSQKDKSKNNPKSQQLLKMTVDEYSSEFQQKGIIKNHQKQILTLLLKKHLQYIGIYTDNLSEQDQYKFDQNQGYVYIKEIKRNLNEEIHENNSKNSNKQDGNHLKGVLESVQNELITNKHQKKSSPSNTQKNQKNQITSLNIPSSDQQSTQFILNNNNEPSLNIISKKLKRQNQFISRNINRIKSYTTTSQQPHSLFTNLQRPQLQQLKISHQISHKLFHIYKTVYPTQIANNKQTQLLNFDNKQQYKVTLNYHKVLEMFKDATVKLQIQQKLSLLRIIKKFSFNSNFVTIQEWAKIYKSIVNTLKVKEVLFQRLVRNKQEEKKQGKFTILLPKAKQQKSQQQNQQYRTRKIKTQSSLPQTKFASLEHLVSQNHNDPSDYSKLDYLTNKSGIKPIANQPTPQPKYNPNQYRTKHKKLLTDVSEVVIKNIKRQLRSQKQKMIGLHENKKQQINQLGGGQDSLLRNQHSYLKKAIKNKKISKLTWQTLFQMKQDRMHYNIVIPEFARQLNDY